VPGGDLDEAVYEEADKDAKQYFGWEAGLNLEQRPPLDVYKPDDYNEFIR